MLKQYNNMNQNKELFNLIEKHLNDIKNDKKTQIIMNTNLNWWFNEFQGETEMMNLCEGYEILRSEVLEIIRLEFLSIIFLDNSREQFEKLMELLNVKLDKSIYIDIIDSSPFEENFDIVTLSYTYKTIKDTNNIYLYSDIWGNIFSESLKYSQLRKWLKIIDSTFRAHNYFWLFVCFSLIKNQNKENTIEELKNAKNLYEFLDLITNSKIIGEDEYYIIPHIKEFQYCIRKGYLSISSLKSILGKSVIYKLWN